MPEPNARSRPPRGHAPQAALTGRALLDILRRVYAVGVILLVLWLSYHAIRYLVVTLMFPASTPAQITGIPTRLTEAMLETRRTQWPGVVSGENPRTPLAHYHRLDGWIEPDRFNSCTQSGCHAPLPHARRKEVRAFLNMHTTSLNCALCHLQSDQQPLSTVWYDLATGQPRSAAPDALRAYGWLMSDEGRQELAHPTVSTQQKLVDLLRGAARGSDDVPALTELAEHVAAVRYDSAAFQQLVDAARTALPRHFRGEYGAKLTLLDRASKGPVLAHSGTEAAVQAYLREAQTADPARKEQLLAAVHPNRRPDTLHCTNCHAAGGLLDFAAAGYPPARTEALLQPAIFTMIEHIARGQPFQLPGFVRPDEPAPEALPPPR
jgi:hypothetical protein